MSDELKPHYEVGSKGSMSYPTQGSDSKVDIGQPTGPFRLNLMRTCVHSRENETRAGVSFSPICMSEFITRDISKFTG